MTNEKCEFLKQVERCVESSRVYPTSFYRNLLLQAHVQECCAAARLIRAQLPEYQQPEKLENE